jgi:hypothetical protein
MVSGRCRSVWVAIGVVISRVSRARIMETAKMGGFFLKGVEGEQKNAQNARPPSHRAYRYTAL